jgi:hypothetical protein
MGIEGLQVFLRDHRRNGMLVDEILGLIFKKDDEIVKPFYETGDFGPVQEMDRDRDLLLPDLVEEIVLEVDAAFAHNTLLSVKMTLKKAHLRLQRE